MMGLQIWHALCHAHFGPNYHKTYTFTHGPASRQAAAFYALPISSAYYKRIDKIRLRGMEDSL